MTVASEGHGYRNVGSSVTSRRPVGSRMPVTTSTRRVAPFGSGVSIPGQSLQDGQWRLAIFTYAYDNGNECGVSVNNAAPEVSNDEWSASITYPDALRLILGARRDLYEWGFYIGDLGEVRIYDRVLTPQEQTALYTLT